MACPSCGYPSEEGEHRCERCGRRFDAAPPSAVSDFEPEDECQIEEFEEPPWEPAAGISADHADHAEPEPALVAAKAPEPASEKPWKRELTTRVRRFRQRRAAQQASLPFDFAPAAEPEPEPAPDPAPPPRRTFSDPSRKVIPFSEIAAARAAVLVPISPRPQDLKPAPPPPPVPAVTAAPPVAVPAPAFNFPDYAPPAPAPEIEVAVAPLVARALAGAVDAAFLIGANALFFGVYTLVGGKFPIQRTALAAMLAASGVLALTYLSLFLCYSSQTPGMAWLGLRLVDFEGKPARRDRRIVRLAGIAASAAAVGFGFWWAAVDEEGLTWHDRISRTLLTLRS